MDIHTPIDYYTMFVALVQRLIDLRRQRDQVDVETAKVQQLIVSTFQLLPKEKQNVFQKEIEDMENQSSGLLDAIKLVFSAHRGEWLTVSKVRDYLIEIGFDFRRYRANPLASINTTIKRMVPAYLESTTSGSGMLYRRRVTLEDRIAERPNRDSAIAALQHVMESRKK
jgi:hypothetical protein